MVFIVAGIFSLAGCIFCPYWIKTAHSTKDRRRGIFSLISSIFMLIMCLWGTIYSNNLLWYGQHKQNSYIEMNIDENVVEKSSFLYLIDQFGFETSVDDVVKVMGENYEVSDPGYEMRYTTSKFTLNGSNSTFISFHFNSRKTEILTIKWAHRAPAQAQFSQTLEYLEKNAFGDASSSSENKADWCGIHLEDTGYYLLLERIF